LLAELGMLSEQLVPCGTGLGMAASRGLLKIPKGVTPQDEIVTALAHELVCITAANAPDSRGLADGSHVRLPLDHHVAPEGWERRK
jgi:hypothetical protein